MAIPIPICVKYTRGATLDECMSIADSACVKVLPLVAVTVILFFIEVYILIYLHIEKPGTQSCIPCAGDRYYTNVWHLLKERFGALTMVWLTTEDP